MAVLHCPTVVLVGLGHCGPPLLPHSIAVPQASPCLPKAILSASRNIVRVIQTPKNAHQP